MIISEFNLPVLERIFYFYEELMIRKTARMMNYKFNLI